MFPMLEMEKFLVAISPAKMASPNDTLLTPPVSSTPFSETRMSLCGRAEFAFLFLMIKPSRLPAGLVAFPASTSPLSETSSRVKFASNRCGRPEQLPVGL